MTGLNIAQVLEHYGGDVSHLSEFGWRAVRCPFHKDAVKSGSVNLEKGAFRCHGCDVRGDAIGLIMQREHLDFGLANEYAQSVFGASIKGVRKTTKKPSFFSTITRLHD